MGSLKITLFMDSVEYIKIIKYTLLQDGRMEKYFVNIDIYNYSLKNIFN